MTTDDEKEDYLRSVAVTLGEHFDHVQILVSWNEEALTKRFAAGTGNWYARQGLAHEFITRDVAQENAHALSKVLPQEPPDETETWRES